MYEIRDRKNRIRAEYRELRRSIPCEVKQAADKALCENFIKSATFCYYDTLLLYCATAEEVDISAIAEKALADGKRIAYPRCEPHSRKMSFHYISSQSELQRGAFGISEPSADLPEVSKAEAGCCVCLIPAVVFDRRGYRIGYGKGYYDRFLSSFPCSKAGIVYSDYILKDVPHGKYDITADVIVTEGGFVQVEKS